MNLFGRKVIYTDVEHVTRGNVVDVLQKAMPIHQMNRADIEYLYRYYKGDQPILGRVKDVRPEINNKIVVNRANEIVSFKVGYLLGEPVQYVSRGNDESVAEGVSKLNDYALSEDKAAKDKDLADWFHICGTSYRMILPDRMADVEEDESPFEIFTLDPRNTFVVYSSGLGHRPILGVTYVQKEDNTVVFCCYSEDTYFEVTETWDVKAEPQILGIPIIEYPANEARLGAFEIVLPLLDAINNVQSNRMDGVEQFVQALMLFHNVDISSEDYKNLRAEGAIKFKDIDATLKADVGYLTAELNQTQTQTLTDDMYDTVLTICGMPNRNGGSSTSDTGSAVIMRDGWSSAEARAKDSEQMFKRSEKQFLKIAIKICNNLRALSLKMSALEIRFTRRNYENISEKASVLVAMLNNGKIAPQLAFTHCGMFSDPQLAYKISTEYAEKQEEKELSTGKSLKRDGETTSEKTENGAEGTAEKTQEVST